MSIDIVGPFSDQRLVIDGWSVPLVSAVELDGGNFNLILDDRLGIQLDIQNFEKVSRFVADVIGTCFGYGCHPSGDDWYQEDGVENPFEDRAKAFARVPHPSLAPRRIVEITAASVEPEGVED